MFFVVRSQLFAGPRTTAVGGRLLPNPPKRPRKERAADYRPNKFKKFKKLLKFIIHFFLFMVK